MAESDTGNRGAGSLLEMENGNEAKTSPPIP